MRTRPRSSTCASPDLYFYAGGSRRCRVRRAVPGGAEKSPGGSGDHRHLQRGRLYGGGDHRLCPLPVLLHAGFRFPWRSAGLLSGLQPVLEGRFKPSADHPGGRGGERHVFRIVQRPEFHDRGECLRSRRHCQRKYYHEDLGGRGDPAPLCGCRPAPGPLPRGTVQSPVSGRSDRQKSGRQRERSADPDLSGSGCCWRESPRRWREPSVFWG